MKKINGTYNYRGYQIVRGNYLNASDDRADRWYIDHPDSRVINHIGQGYRTLIDAQRAINDKIKILAADACQGINPEAVPILYNSINQLIELWRKGEFAFSPKDRIGEVALKSVLAQLKAALAKAKA